MSLQNEPIHVGFHFPGNPELAPNPMLESLLAQLTQSGFCFEPLEQSARPSVALVFFDHFRPELLDLLRRHQDNGSSRILALAARGRELRGGIIWELMEAGAADVFALDGIPDPAACIAARLERWVCIDQLMLSPEVQEILAGQSPTWRSVLRQIVEVGRFTDSSVLITGESGTGKELVARLIHGLDQRENKGPFVVLDCSTVVAELSGSEFFGHERGAFTHAVAAREGAFALAEGGTLFLDEVGELPPGLQAELLRVVQERTYKRVGSNIWRSIRFRLVCATNRDLEKERARGSFRSDFYFRIAPWSCRLPSLQERREDVLPLAFHFLRQLHPNAEPPGLDPAVRDYLLLRDYPGNIRELRHLVATLGKRHVGPGPITAGDIPEEEWRRAKPLTRMDWRDAGFKEAIRTALSQGVNLKEISAAATDLAIRIALDEESGSLPRAARKLGVTDRALQLRRAAERERS